MLAKAGRKPIINPGSWESKCATRADLDRVTGMSMLPIIHPLFNHEWIGS